MEKRVFELEGHEITGYVIPIGSVNLVFAHTSKGVVGCGAIDAVALEKFAIPAVKIRPVTADSIRSIDDLLTGMVAVINSYAQQAGVVPEMNGKQALVTLI